ncbi:DUF4249 domain-containing protein [Hymenobacter chitinivorans]|uniref:Uncharacterized protein DUF4249 n=1 Tax=Hymenobacter chitinivorans DSM 11115 TaxID=1121954 RepID=A0A2M9B5H3_9BACT|nr:DUF4249 domain-containing protein [Hymenobacter chitinivorans]PJJ53192.1 uncharacterized protein DUF4249 [Hymenobacter chitinivorans DSM 11115]
MIFPFSLLRIARGQTSRRGGLLGAVALLLGLLSGCIEDYSPDVPRSKTQFLVVDGFINTQGPTTIKLSRSTNLNQNTAPVVETKAQVAIEDATSVRALLTETAPGTYVSASQQLVPGRNYRLTIKTSAGRTYASALTAAKVTPPIDKLSWKADNAGVDIYVDTHDESGQTGFYRWEYDETWAFTSAFNSELQYANQVISPRQENIYSCWDTQSGGVIRINSTTGLSQDVVRGFPMAQVPRNSIKLRLRYSILAHQYALSQEEYQYWETLRKNTETLGTPFDPLPSQVQGNVHCLQDATEPVLGFVGVTSMTEKRLFISRPELPDEWRFLDTNYLACTAPDTLWIFRGDYTIAEFFGNASYRIPIAPLIHNGRVDAYTAYTPECVDCRVHGTNVKPSFW